MKQERLEATDETVEPARESGIFADLAVRQTSELPRAEGRSIPPPPPPTRSSILPVARRAESAGTDRDGFEAADAQEEQQSEQDELLEQDELDAADDFEDDALTPNQVMTPASLIRPDAAPVSTGRTLPPPPPRQSAPSLPGTSFPKTQASAHQHTIPPGMMAVSPLVANAPVAFPATQPVPRDTSGTYQKVEPAPQVEPVRAYVAAPQPQAALSPTPSQPAPHALDAPYAAVAARTATSQVPYAMLIVGALIAACFAWYMLAAKAVPGVVQLTTAPADADVLFDGVKVGSVSPFLKTGVEPGIKHTLEVKKAGFRTWAQEVEVQSGQTLIFTVALPSEAGDDAPSVAPVSAPAVAAAAPVLAAPAVAEPAPVAAAPSAVAVPSVPAPAVAAPSPARAVQAKAETSPVKAAAAAAPSARRASAATPNAAASGATGTLRVSARPWAVVTIDGKLIGNTPQMNLTLSEGSHRVVLSNPEFHVEKVMNVSIQAGKVETLIVNLL